MPIQIDVDLVYDLSQPTDIMLQIEASHGPGQLVTHEHIHVPDTEHFARVAAQDDIGNRLWLRVANRLSCKYTATVEVQRTADDIARLDAVPPHLLPGDTVRYMLPSRYCPADEFQSYVNAEFGTSFGGARIAAMRDWITDKIAYVSGSSGPKTTALETFVHRQGVCRDFAHLMVTLARASAIPARFASVYAPGVQPPDFHAVAEVYLNGAWHFVDATGMADPGNIALVGVGTDAAEVAFLTSYGNAMIVQQTVNVSQTD